MRLRLFAAAGAALALVALSACGPSSSDHAPATDEAPVSEAAPESEAPASEAAPAPAPEVKQTGQNASVDRYGEPQFEDGADVEDIAATGDTRRRDPTPPADASETAETPVEGQ